MYRENPPDVAFKRILFILPIFVFLLILLWNFYKLQINKGESFQSVSKSNIIRSFDVLPIRGDIHDRNNKLLVDSRPAYSVLISPYLFKTDTVLRAKFFAILSDSIAEKNTLKRLKKRRYGKNEKMLVKRHISQKLMTEIIENSVELPGISVRVDPKRHRMQNIRASHTIGYIKEVTDRELDKFKQYKLGDVIGKSGIERQYDSILFGVKGKKNYVADAYGNPVSELQDEFGFEEKAVDGRDLYLTLDSKMQSVAESLMVGKRGSIVAIDAKTGGVLSIVSSPDYEPDILAKPISNKDWTRLISRKQGMALLNRSLRGQYPPGSVYKMIPLIAALNEGIVSKNWKVKCEGSYSLSDRDIHCWNRKGHGEVNAKTAISSSCNVYFYHLIQKVGLERWAKYSRLFQFGKITNIDLPGEKKGVVPDSSYYKKNKQFFSKGKLLNLAIGQGELLTTPLQIAQYTQIIANKGRFFRPHLLDGTTKKYGDKIIPEVFEEKTIDIEIKDHVWRTIFSGMKHCVNGKYFATGKNARIEKVVVMGKTGTAQVPPRKSHSWFTGFAPEKDPEIVVTILIEHGGSGGGVAAPVARSVFEQYFYGKVLAPKPIIIEDDVEPIEIPEIVLPLFDVRLPMKKEELDE
jgi:penicillin-binding protein 2